MSVSLSLDLDFDTSTSSSSSISIPDDMEPNFTIKPDDIKVWFMCKFCQGCFCSVKDYLEHANEAHPGLPVIMPLDLPPEAESGRIFVPEDLDEDSSSNIAISDSDNEESDNEQVDGPCLEKNQPWNNERSIRDWVNRLHTPPTYAEDDSADEYASPRAERNSTVSDSQYSHPKSIVVCETNDDNMYSDKPGNEANPKMTAADVVCKHCNKQFPKICFLNFHMKKVHSAIDPQTVTEEQSNTIESKLDKPMSVNNNITTTKTERNCVKKSVVANVNDKDTNVADSETRSLSSLKMKDTFSEKASDDEVISVRPTSKTGKKAMVLDSDSESLFESSVLSSTKRRSPRKRKFSGQLRRSSRIKNDEPSVIDVTKSEVSESNTTPKKTVKKTEKLDAHASISSISSGSVKCLSDDPITDELFVVAPKNTTKPKKEDKTCDLCGLKCQDSATLVHHMQTVHKGKSFVLICGFCQKRFSSKKGFNTHIKQHQIQKQ